MSEQDQEVDPGADLDPAPVQEVAPKARAIIVPEQLKDVPTSLESFLQQHGGSDKRSYDVLGILVEAQERSAEAILGRTNVTRNEVQLVADAFQLARHGIGGLFDDPNPGIGEWILTVLRALPSVGGASRKEFVSGWQNAKEERMKEALQEEERRRRMMGG
ncbi:MAG TPA: hypothetical protein VJ327_09830 [Patescibacteria group bacterium]|nr:hypothetical protein [Patescibacteria group bacterium]